MATLSGHLRRLGERFFRVGRRAVHKQSEDRVAENNAGLKSCREDQDNGPEEDGLNDPKCLA